MKSSDKVLIGIVVGIVLLIVVALVVTMNRPEAGFVADDNPEGVVNNYLFALREEDYERAYSYLSPNVYHYPRSVSDFRLAVKNNSYRFRTGYDVEISIEDSTISGKRATVTVQESRFYGGDLFSSGQSVYSFDMELELYGNDWKIIESYYYFAYCWTNIKSDCY